MAKQLCYEHEARSAVRAGVAKLARAVKSTLGPKGRNAVLDKGYGGPKISKDGVTVAEEIDLVDPYENIGAQMVKEAASKTGDNAGDGTTTATVLAEAIFAAGLKHVTSGANPMGLNIGINKAVEKVVAALVKASRPISDRKSIMEVATIAGNNDASVGKLIADAFDRVGKDGVVTIEEGKSLDTEMEIVEGMQFDRGYLSPHFVTNKDSLECVYDKPLILITEDKISTVKKIIPLLEKIIQAKRSLVIIAEDVESEALATLVVNKMRGICEVCAIKAPGYGDRRKAMLQDLAIVTGGKAIFKDLGIDLEKVELRDLGTAERVTITSEDTVVVKGAGKAKDVEARAAAIRREIEDTDSDYDKEKLQERLAKLVGGIAQINIGAATETEVKEKKDRFDDALHATRAALEEGVLPGGGVALLRAVAALADLKLAGDEGLGVEAVRSALPIPLRQIADNAGVEGALVARKVLGSKSAAFGYDAAAGRYGDMFEFGIVDPTKVVRSALQNAASVATMLLTTDCLIADKPEGEDDGDDDHDHGGHMDF